MRVAADGSLRVLLVTSRDTRRWVVPRGNPISGLAPSASAAQEAFEEAGVRGAAAETSIGRYRYRKRRKGGTVVPAEVHLFRLAVTEELDDWPERRERERRWFEPRAAAAAVDEPELKALLLSLERRGA